MKLIMVASLQDALCRLKRDGFDVIGIEISTTSAKISERPFRRNTAFVCGSEGRGMSQDEMKACDSFVYVPQPGAGVACLNVSMATSIVLHHFAEWVAAKSSSSE
mmetsp:Transcript_17626/g.26410  ORF Transcript_17626/g.26410 Transcript_17626/m.26410 type:complete len:105 (+) Transcript_17626:1052-1366(+)